MFFLGLYAVSPLFIKKNTNPIGLENILIQGYLTLKFTVYFQIRLYLNILVNKIPLYVFIMTIWQFFWK